MPRRPVTDLTELSDHDLLLGGREDVIAENRAGAQRWARLVEFYRRREQQFPAKNKQSQHFALTARQETVVEVGELWGMSATWVRKQLNVALCLSEHFPDLWALCLDGRLDGYRATLVAEAATTQLDHPEERWRFATRITAFLLRHLRSVEGGGELVTCTHRQLRNKIAYELRLLRSGDAEERFRKKYADRAVTGHDDEDGMSWLSISNTTDQVRLAHHRLTLAAKQKRADGDDRTLDQLRADLAIDLLTGKEEGVPVPTYARPIVNLTVPIQTVMGLADDPGVLSGGTVIPAALCRKIAQEPGATWHRMLTDPAGTMLELSTTTYKPTKAIWSWVVAEQASCFRSGCDGAATEDELDHRVRWPDGRTSTSNLWPGCRSDHKAKHAPGFSIEQTADGSFALRRPAGFKHPVGSTVQRVGDAVEDVPEEIQFSATEIRDAIEFLRARDADLRPFDLSRLWEDDPDLALAEALERIGTAA
jgi:hypothetical protein